MKQYTRRVFNMYGGEPHRVVLQFTNDLINAVYDRFGKAGDILYRVEDDRHFVVTVEVETSPQFYGWLCCFGNKAKIIQPKTVKDEFLDYLSKITYLYHR